MKRPWMKLFVADFLLSEDVVNMPDDACGVYIKLLCHNWEKGDLPSDPDALAKILNRDRRYFRRIWKTLCRHFRETSPGRLTNFRVEVEQKSAGSKSEKSSKAANIRHHGHADALPYRSRSEEEEGEGDGDKCKSNASLPPISDRFKSIQASWIKHTGVTFPGDLSAVAVACENAARAQSPPADPEQYADRCFKAFVDWINSIERKDRRPQKSAAKFLEHFSRIQEMIKQPTRPYATSVLSDARHEQSRSIFDGILGTEKVE